jgi:glycosyltransferase involved in cell wall biosynthesis
MRILILQDDFPPQSFGGAGFSTFYFARGLLKAGQDVFVITTCRDKSAEGSENYQGLKVFRVYANYHDRWRGYLSLYNPQTVSKIKKLIGEINPDIVHANNIQSYLSYYCLRVTKKLGKPVFWTARDVSSFNYGKLATKRYLREFNCKTNWLDHLKQAGKRYNPLRNFLIKRYLKYVDKIFAISQALKEALEQNGIKNAEVSHTSIEVDDWSVSPEKVEAFRKKYDLHGKKVIFFGGRISGLKGVKQINQALDKIKKEVPQAFLLMAGSGGVGWLSGDDLRAAYHSADVVVVPSACFDSFPRSNLEAMACHKPVVATCYGGSREVVQEGVTGFVVNPFDAELMAEKIVYLLKNPEKARQFGEAGHERVKKDFNPDSQIAQIVSCYQKLL